jgi:hypothetical protein
MFYGVARAKDDFQCRKVIHNSDNHFLWHDAVNGGDVTRKQFAFRGEEAPITLSENKWHRAERLHRRKEETVAFIARSSFAPIDRVPRMAHFVEVPKLFYGRHPKIGTRHIFRNTAPAKFDATGQPDFLSTRSCSRLERPALALALR